MSSSDELKLIRGSDGTINSLSKAADENNISRFFIILKRVDILNNPALALFEEIAEAGFLIIFDTARMPEKYFKPGDQPEFVTTPDKLLKLQLQGGITEDQMENIFWKNANRFFDLGLE